MIDKFRFKASKAAMVQSKLKTVAKLAPIERLSHERNLDFSFTEAPFPGKRMLQIKNLSFAYPNGPQLIEDLSIEIFKGDRVGIIGPNGRGKTTLLNLIANELNACNGQIEYNPNIKTNYFGQTNINRLHLENTVEEEIQTAVPDSSRGRARSLAGLMMFSGDSALKKVRVLSGGERSRVLLGKILATSCNLLLLDEPTNHLDMESIESLIDALEDYEGTAMVVTHDEELLHAFANRLIVFDQGECFSFEGSYQDFLDNIGWKSEKKEAMTSLPQTQTEKKEPVVPNKENRKARADYIAERSRLLKPLEKELARTEESIKKQETLALELEQKLVLASEQNDGESIASLAKKLDENKKQIDHLYDSWEIATANHQEVLAKYPLD